MSNELDLKKDLALQSMMNVEVLPITPEVNLEMHNATKIPLANLSALGVAFQPLTTAIQTAVFGAGGSGIYFVNTMGKQMFHIGESTDFIGSLMSSTGGVGGGQARMTPLACDPTMLFMAVTLMNIEKSSMPSSKRRKTFYNFWKKKSVQRYRVI